MEGSGSDFDEEIIFESSTLEEFQKFQKGSFYENYSGYNYNEPDVIMSEHQDRSFLESEVFNGLRVWHISGMIIGAVMIIIISLCCLCKCRIPRTRKEIEANAKRRRDRRKRRNGKEDPEEEEESTPLTGVKIHPIKERKQSDL